MRKGRQIPVAAAALGSLVLAVGCAPKSAAYRLVVQPGGRVLIPPGVAKPDLPQRVFKADVAPGRGSCASTEAVAVAQQRRGLRVTVKRDALGKQQQGWLGAWALQAESQGCVAPGEGLALAARILESVPLDPAAPARLLTTTTARSGYVDVRPYARLQVVVPVLRAGAAPDAPLFETAGVSGNGGSLTVDLKASSNLLGYETSWYAVRPKTGAPGCSIASASVERVINGAPEQASEPLANYFRFSPRAGFFRLFYKTDQASGKVTEMVLASASLPELDRLTKEVDGDPGVCDKLAGELCAAIPQRSAVNPFVDITVNGKALAVHAGSLSSAIRAAGEADPARVLPTLTVDRLYAGRLVPVQFDRTTRDILELTLNGGERISW